jgi:integrase
VDYRPANYIQTPVQKRSSMQNGSVIRTKRRNGQSVWEFRWRDRTSGRAIYRRIVLGTTQQFATETEAREAIAGIVLEINVHDPRFPTSTLTITQLTEHYRRRELTADNVWKSYATKKGYEIYLKRWIVPRWGDYRLSKIKPIEVELWLRQLPLALGSCAKIRNIMSVLFNHACRYELYSENPIRLVRQSAKRRKVPHILRIEEIKQLLGSVGSLTHLLIFFDVTTGLRQSELFGLRWSDLDFDNGEISVVRSVVHGIVSRCKTETSAKPIPMDPLLAEMLKEWRKVTRYRSPDDWVFASKRAKGKRPIWGQSIMRKQIHPALEKLGIEKRIGWHTFRHSYSTLLRHLGTDIKVQQDLLRHSSARLTLDTYTQAVTPAKRNAQNAVVQLLLPAESIAIAAPTAKLSNVSI